LEKIDVDPANLILEITESAIILDPARAQETLEALHGMDVSLSIDDFGTGYTSLASITKLPVNEIKIDRSFVNGMLANDDDATIVRSVIELGHNLGLKVVAEGVETKAMLDWLNASGCDQAQGFFISQPRPCEQLRGWLTTSPWKPAPAG
jgi:EAL domain-containing protein (putative c-di-GMP-specific phosphodiesterase class I)